MSFNMKRFALLGLAIMTTFWVGCSKGSKDETPASTQLYQAYKSCKARTGNQMTVYYCGPQDAYYNCDCVQDLQAQSLVAYKSQNGTGYNYNYGYNNDEAIINNYINSYLSQVSADSKRRMIEQWNKIGTQSANYGQNYNQNYNQQQQQQNNYYYQWCTQNGGWYDQSTGMCWPTGY